jgi:hypothetical protein
VVRVTAPLRELEPLNEQAAKAAGLVVVSEGMGITKVEMVRVIHAYLEALPPSRPTALRPGLVKAREIRATGASVNARDASLGIRRPVVGHRPHGDPKCLSGF